MSKFRMNYSVERNFLREPNCNVLVKEIRRFVYSPIFDKLPLKSKTTLLTYIQEIERRNRCIDNERLHEIKRFIKDMKRTYGN